MNVDNALPNTHLESQSLHPFDSLFHLLVDAAPSDPAVMVESGRVLHRLNSQIVECEDRRKHLSCLEEWTESLQWLRAAESDMALGTINEVNNDNHSPVLIEKSGGDELSQFEGDTVGIRKGTLPLHVHSRKQTFAIEDDRPALLTHRRLVKLGVVGLVEGVGQ